MCLTAQGRFLSKIYEDAVISKQNYNRRQVWHFCIAGEDKLQMCIET
jgi:hypothetical protein